MAVDVTDELVDRIATLARLALSASEREELKAHFDKVLRFVAELETLDLEGVEPSASATADAGAHRKDEVMPSLDPEAALANAPARSGTAFVVPRIVGASSGGGTGIGDGA